MDEPTISLKTLAHVFGGESDLGGTFNGDVVVVVEKNQVIEPQKTRQRTCFGGDAFHQVAVAANSVNLIINDLVPGPVEKRGQIFFRNRHAHRIAEKYL